MWPRRPRRPAQPPRDQLERRFDDFRESIHRELDEFKAAIRAELGGRREERWRSVAVSIALLSSAVAIGLALLGGH